MPAPDLECGMPAPGLDRSMRASDRDRERATEVLREAYAVGRLALDEFLERTDAACCATTWDDLCQITADLPERWRLFRTGPSAGPQCERAELYGASKGNCRPLWVMALIWLAIAAAAHVAAAIPLVLLALFLVRAARWR
jgi:hypothetical protein